IRFIKDLHDTGGGGPRGSSKGANSHSKYGVAVRVQGIAGQPYVVLKEGEKGDSYGVQLKPDPRSYASSLQAYNSLPRRRDEGGAPGMQVGAEGEVGSLRRARSQGSLLERERETGEDFSEQLRRPPGDGRSGSYGNLDGGVGIGGGERERGSVREPLTTTESRGGRGPWGGPYQEGVNGSLGGDRGRDGGGGRYASMESFPDPPPPVSSMEEPPEVVDTNSLAPINRLISKFDGGSSGGQTRGRSGARGRLNSEERKRSRSLDARDNAPEMSASPSLPSSTSNPYSSPPSSTTSSYSSLGRNSGSVARVAALPAHTTASDWSAGSFVARETQPVSQIEAPASEGASEAWRAEKRDLERRLTDLQSALDMERKLEDQLSGLQEELRKESDNRAQSDTLQTELMSARAELAEAAVLRQRQEETLRQRERELTALKGALKDEVATHDREIETLREQYSQDMERLRSSMEQVSQSQQHIEAERQRVNSSMRTMQQQLEDCREEGSHWREQFQLLQARLEKEEFEEELKELQERLTTMKCQIPDPNQTNTLKQDLQNCRVDLKLAQSELEKLKVDFDKRGMEIISLKKSNQEREAELKYETDRLKDQSRKDKEDLVKAQEKVKQLPDKAVLQELQAELEQARGEASRWHESLANMQSSASQSLETEQALEEQNRSLRQQLEEARRSSIRLGQEQEELSRRLEEREHEREALRRSLTELEEQKRKLDRALDKANKELDKELLTNRLKHLEGELESQRGSHTDRSREIRSLEDKVKHLELELDEERNSVELLTDRMTRSRDQYVPLALLFHCAPPPEANRVSASQIDQLRSELMQEKSSKQDLELDKNALERQMKELKSRMADMEGQSRSSAGVSQLQSKALKRQVDESEGEVERLEGLRRKAQREVEEQLEQKEALQTRVTALEAELKRKVQQSRRPALDSSALSSEEEDDEEGFYDPSSITSILTESNLQTSSC
ncbi:hypothetical protein JZ751_009931, partial [Albula glossodonta]